MSRILVIEDDPDIRAVIVATLESAQHKSREEGSGSAAVEVFRQYQPDLVLLDIGLPGLDGLEVCRRLRAISRVPIVMLTARTDELDELLGLGLGADDYLRKPFLPRVLLARIAAALRRVEMPTSESEIWHRADDRLVIDVEARTASIKSEDGSVQQTGLTRIEFDLLCALAREPRRVVTRKQLLRDVWDDWYGDDHLVETHLSRLRAKIGAAGGPRIAIAVRGVGYRLGPA